MGSIGEDQELFEALSASKMYSDYRDAFAKATGLPLTLHKCRFLQPLGQGKVINPSGGISRTPLFLSGLEASLPLCAIAYPRSP